MTSPEEVTAARVTHEEVCTQVAVALHEATDPLVAAGRASVSYDEAQGEYRLRPTSKAAAPLFITVSTEREIVLGPTAPGTDRTLALELHYTDPSRLISAFGSYLEAILAGRVALTVRHDQARGRITIRHRDGTESRHYYNVWIPWLVGRGPGWETFRPAAYG